MTGLPLVAFGTFDPGQDGGLHALIRRFRAGDAGAFVESAAAARAAIGRASELAERRGVVVVPVPDHLPGTHDGPRLALALELARAFGWVAPDPPPLRRLEPVVPAKERAPRDPTHEKRSLGWDDAAVGPGALVLLLDDVLASGATLAACVAAIRRDGPADREVAVLVLARAVPGSARP